VRLSEVDGVVPAVVLRHLLLDDVGLDRHAEVIGLAGQIGGDVIVLLLRLERGIAQIAPEDREHPELMCLLEHPAHFLDLPLRFLRPEVDGSANGHGPHVERLFHAGEANLIE
jgi:hypothetical protein